MSGSSTEAGGNRIQLLTREGSIGPLSGVPQDRSGRIEKYKSKLCGKSLHIDADNHECIRGNKNGHGVDEKKKTA